MKITLSWKIRMAHCLRKNRGLGQISCKQLAF